MVEMVAALAHPPGWCVCLPSMPTRLDELQDYLSRNWSLTAFLPRSRVPSRCRRGSTDQRSSRTG